MRKPPSPDRRPSRYARAGAWTFGAALLVVGLGLDGRDVHAETMTCLGACRVEYGACLMEAKSMDPEPAAEHRVECGKGYLRCAKKCKQGTP